MANVTRKKKEDRKPESAMKAFDRIKQRSESLGLAPELLFEQIACLYNNKARALELLKAHYDPDNCEIRSDDGKTTEIQEFMFKQREAYGRRVKNSVKHDIALLELELGPASTTRKAIRSLKYMTHMLPGLSKIEQNRDN